MIATVQDLIDQLNKIENKQTRVRITIALDNDYPTLASRSENLATGMHPFTFIDGIEVAGDPLARGESVILYGSET